MSERNIKLPLFLTRLSVFYFLIYWTLKRFTDFDTVSSIASRHYYMDSFPAGLNLALGVFGLVSLISFLLGFKKRYSYLAVFLMHGTGTVLVIPKMILYTEGFRHLFLAAIPTLAAIWLLYKLRDEDTLFTIDK